MFSLSPPIHAKDAVCLGELRDWSVAGSCQCRLWAWLPIPSLQGHPSAMDWPEQLDERRGQIFNGHLHFTLALLPVSVLEEVFEEEKVKASYFRN